MNRNSCTSYRFRRATLCLIGGFVVALLWVFGLRTARAEGPLLIATGWDSPTPARFRAELTQFEKWGPFDGTTIYPTRKTADGKVGPAHNAFSREKWKWSEFDSAVADLTAVKPKRATANFLFLYANPGDVDWFDDAGWREVADHWRLLARAAKRAGMRGLLYDAEPYTPPFSQFCYAAQPGRKAHTFAEYTARARQRGREVMRAVAEEYPEITIFTFRLFCDLMPALEGGNLQAALAPNPYGLHPAFVDGWCDVMPAGVRIVEGDEDAYRFNSDADFCRAFTRLSTRLPEFVSPENRQKFHSQLRIGHGIYLDAHVSPPGAPWHIDRLGGTPADRLAANTASALAASNGCVWIYGEKGRWWPGGDRSFRTWPEIMPGAETALRRAHDPLALVREALAKITPQSNLLKNPSFAEGTAEGLPKEWWTWQDDRSHGKFSRDHEAASMAGMESGTFGQNVPVKSGQRFAVRVRVRMQGEGFANLSVGWKTPEGRWFWPAMRTFAAGPADAQGWCEASGMAEVPPEAGFLVFMLGVRGQSQPTDRAWFDDAQLARLPQ